MLLLVFIYGVYQVQLKSERSQASQQVNQLLKASLENAMLKRDLPGLQMIIDRLTKQKSIEQVVILNPKGEIRFASDKSLIGQLYPEKLANLCSGCEGSFQNAKPLTHLLDNEKGRTVLRSVNPVHNKQPCDVCHGPPKKHPVNGILIVDYDAKPIVTKARSGLIGLSLLGLIVTLLTFAVVWWFMCKHVIQPLQALTHASNQLSMGNLDARVELCCKDELSELGETFNTMAERLQNSMYQLLDKEDYSQALINAIPDGIRVIDGNYRVLQVNTAYNALLQKEFTAKMPCYESSHCRDKACISTLITCPLEEIRKHGKPIKVMQTFIRGDDEPLEVQVFSAPLNIINSNGDKLCCIVQSIRDLQHDVQYSQEQRLATLGQLAAGVGHEILNPLTSIRFALQSTLKNLLESPDNISESINYMRLVDGEIDKCIDVTNRLLKLSTPQDEFHQLIDINVSIQETVSLLKYEGEQYKINIKLDMDNQQPRILASESDIRMLVLNLIQNAFHAMPKGGDLIISTNITESKVICYFCDKGVGISQEDMPHIFEPFFTHRADDNKGIGLGLAICYSIIERYNGTIEAYNRSEENDGAVGACFKVTLSLAGEE